jgi:ribose 5-phosphate isomerase A
VAHENAKRAAAEYAARLVEDGMTVGLGTGSTVAFLLSALASRGLDLLCVATSPATEKEASRLGLRVRPFEGLDRLDIAIDGADQVDPACWLVKGGGGAHTREKVVALAAERFVVIASAEKMVEGIKAPIPLELLGFGLAATCRELGDVRLRPGVTSPDGGLIADWYGEVGELEELAASFDAQPGVVAHGLFRPEMVEAVVVGDEAGNTRVVSR